MSRLAVQCMRNGQTKLRTVAPGTTIAELMEWQERRIGRAGYESISILVDGVIYSTHEA